jgi:hypothetical protein
MKRGPENYGLKGGNISPPCGTPGKDDPGK